AAWCLSADGRQVLHLLHGQVEPVPVLRLGHRAGRGFLANVRNQAWPFLLGCRPTALSSCGGSAAKFQAPAAPSSARATAASARASASPSAGLANGMPAASPPAGYRWVGSAAQGVWFAVPDSWA